MLSASCHCGAVRITVPRRPTRLTNCNCSICRRLGGLWAYYLVRQVRIEASPDATDEYIWGDKTLRVVRCKSCGCVTHWAPLRPTSKSKMGVNARNFNPTQLGNVRIRLFDGASTWKYVD